MKVSQHDGQDLRKDAIDLALEKSMQDINTLLTWTVETESAKEALRHVRRCKELLDEMEDNLQRVIES